MGSYRITLTCVISLLLLISLISLSWAGPSRSGPKPRLHNPAPRGAAQKMTGPDLVIEKFWVETVKPGQKMLNNQIADKTYLYFNWKVRNVGDRIASSSKLAVSCSVMMGKGPCPLGSSANFNIPQLWPRPKNSADPSGSTVVWNQQAFPAPDSVEKYRFVATIDPARQIAEKNEQNNRLTSMFTSPIQGRKKTPLKPPKQPNSPTSASIKSPTAINGKNTPTYVNKRGAVAQTKGLPFDTTLQVKAAIGDVFNKWVTTHTLEQPKTLLFRYSTQVKNILSVKKEVLGVNGGMPIQLNISNISAPPPGAYAMFTYPFTKAYEKFIVKITVKDTSGQEHQGVPVEITMAKNGGPTPTIQLSQVVLTIDKIVMIDDSDDLSSGEITFCFWADYSGGTNGKTPIVSYYNGNFNSGTEAQPGTKVVINGTPHRVTLYVKGSDNDADEEVFTTGTGPSCSGSTTTFDFAEGSRTLTIPPGATMTNKHPFMPFKATGSEDLEFEIHGSWQIQAP